MPQDYHHGVRVIELSGGGPPIRSISTAVLGIICTAPDADEDAFPLDTPVLVTNVISALAKAGTKGTLRATLDAIGKQTKPMTVVVRVAEDDDAGKLASNVIGTVTPDGKYTGAKALLTAQTHLAVRPRIIVAPGLDTMEVTEELVSIAQSLRAFVYASANGCKTKEEAVAYRKKFGQRELMIIWPDFIGWDDTTNAPNILPAPAFAAGMRAKIDNDIGWHKTLSNVVINGVTGISADVSWDLQDPATDAGYLNENEVTTLINSNGFRFWGSRTCSTDTKFVFENYTRTAHVVADTLAESRMADVDAALNPSFVKDMVEEMNAWFRRQVSAGYLIGGRAWYDPEPNTRDELESGGMFLDHDYTPVPPLENLRLRQRITDRYLVAFDAAASAIE